MFNRAIDENIAEATKYPFGNQKGKYSLKKPDSVKIGLTFDEVKSLEKLDLSSNKYQNHARNVWLFSFYLAGMRVGDVLKIKWQNIQNGRLHYQMNKNKKISSFKISDKLRKILDYYEQDSFSADDFIFPELKGINSTDSKKVFRATKNATEKFNGHLKAIALQAGINKKLTMHIARHSFGNIAGDKIHPLMLQKLYLHPDLKTTINYQANFIHKEADAALESVIGD